MTVIDLVLSLALLTSLGFCAWLWARRQPTPTPPVPPPDPAPDPLAALRQPTFLAVVGGIDTGVIVVDPTRQIQFLNESAEALLGIGQPLRGQGLIAMIRDHQADALVAQALRDGESREITLKPIPSGRTLRLRCTPLGPSGQISGAMLLIHDVTQISMLERARRDLVANVSHELRTPLASLKLLVETVQSAPPPEVVQRMLGLMAQEIDAVTQLVNELHELAQIESGRVTLKLSPTPLLPVVERAIARIRPQADRSQITISAEIQDEQCLALIDADRIGQVLLNLLHNAVKFNRVGGAVVVRATLVAPVAPAEATADDPCGDGDWFHVSVSDTGIGIASQDLPRIFERFYKVDRARTRHAGGTGLGLAIAKHLIEGHSGRLWAESIEGRGSTFSFTLPVA
ncbi:MAG: ATP-binding protein [Chloroflexales bacterium]